MIYKSSKQLTLLVILSLAFAFPLSASEETPLVCDELPAIDICGDGFLADPSASASLSILSICGMMLQVVGNGVMWRREGPVMV